ncbi:MAG: PilZ domain-containing protein [Proteobacteria bacterium]|nr:PilZ domain-containing protein [Pseudomonadota bacterium]
MRCMLTARRPFEQSVKLWVSGQAQGVTGRARDLSRGGIFVCLPEPAPVDSELRLQFELPGAGTVEADAVVVRVTEPDHPLDPPGMALRFRALGPAASAELTRLLAPQPSYPVVDTIADDEWDPVHTAAYALHAAAALHATAGTGASSSSRAAPNA